MVKNKCQYIYKIGPKANQICNKSCLKDVCYLHTPETLIKKKNNVKAFKKNNPDKNNVYKEKARKKAKYYYEKYKDYYNEYKKKYYMDHIDEKHAYKSSYYERHKESIKAKQKLYRLTHKEEINRKQRNYYVRKIRPLKVKTRRLYGMRRRKTQKMKEIKIIEVEKPVIKEKREKKKYLACDKGCEDPIMIEWDF
jgi:hypothetical protein